MLRFLLPLLSCAALAAEPCRVEIVDKENGWPVPLVELRTTHETRHVSDNFGLIAIDSPELLGREVWFHVIGHGYGVPKDGFGYQGLRANLKAGAKFRIEVERRMPAKRIGRLTGAGLFAEGARLGETPLQPESGVFGCDSVLLAKHDGKLFWLWGDTTLPGYPLGVFHSTAATTSLEPLKEFRPPLAMPFTYFRDPDSKPRGVARMAGEGPTWLTGMASVDGRLVATYSKIRHHLEEYETGLCAWSPAKASFIHEKTMWKKADGAQPLMLRGHPVRWRDDAGKSWLLFGDPFPAARCPDDFESWQNPATWEKVPRPAAPKLADGTEIRPHRGSIAWSAFRNRWITIITRQRGASRGLGEIWYAESASPLGPWTGAVKVLEHENYTFYNPRIQIELTPDDAPFILFEGTCTAEFANHARPTPRHNYNQILYRLDFADVAAD